MVKPLCSRKANQPKSRLTERLEERIFSVVDSDGNSCRRECSASINTDQADLKPVRLWSFDRPTVFDSDRHIGVSAFDDPSIRGSY